MLRGLRAQEPQREKSLPDTEDDSGYPLEQPGRQDLPVLTVGSRNAGEEEHEERDGKGARHDRVGSPPTPLGTSKAPYQHETGGREGDEYDQTRDVVDGAAQA